MLPPSVVVFALDSSELDTLVDGGARVSFGVVMGDVVGVLAFVEEGALVGVKLGVALVSAGATVTVALGEDVAAPQPGTAKPPIC